MAVKGVQGNMAAQSRIMGHDAVVVDFGIDIAGTESRGAALYVGIAVSVLTVVMETPLISLCEIELNEKKLRAIH